jgi:hypothetical protein
MIFRTEETPPEESGRLFQVGDPVLNDMTLTDRANFRAFRDHAVNACADNASLPAVTRDGKRANAAFSHYRCPHWLAIIG